MARIGYARVSTANKQTTGSQTLALRNAGCERIFEDQVTGASNLNSRSAWADLLSYAREDDSIVVYSMSRIGRPLKGIIETLDELEALRLTLVSITEGFDLSTHWVEWW